MREARRRRQHRGGKHQRNRCGEHGKRQHIFWVEYEQRSKHGYEIETHAGTDQQPRNDPADRYRTSLGADEEPDRSRLNALRPQCDVFAPSLQQEPEDEDGDDDDRHRKSEYRVQIHQAGDVERRQTRLVSGECGAGRVTGSIWIGVSLAEVTPSMAPIVLCKLAQ